MTLKDIKKYYRLYKQEDKYLLYSLTEQGDRTQFKYKWHILKKGNAFYVEGYNPTTKIDVLIKNIDDKISSLPYDSEYYNIGFREGYFEYLIINDYIRNLGFEHLNNNTYVYKKATIYGDKSPKYVISVYELCPHSTLKQEVRITLNTGQFSWVEVKSTRNVEDIKNSIDALLKPLFLANASNDTILADSLKNAVSDIQISELNGLSINSKKLELKEKLQTIINML